MGEADKQLFQLPRAEAPPNPLWPLYPASSKQKVGRDTERPNAGHSYSAIPQSCLYKEGLNLVPDLSGLKLQASSQFTSTRKEGRPRSPPPPGEKLPIATYQPKCSYLLPPAPSSSPVQSRLCFSQTLRFPKGPGISNKVQAKGVGWGGRGRGRCKQLPFCSSESRLTISAPPSLHSPPRSPVQGGAGETV